MDEFDVTLTYAKGDVVMFCSTEYIFDPNDNEDQFSIGLFPSNSQGWERKTFPDEEIIEEILKDCDLDFDWMTSKSYKMMVIRAMKEYAKYKLEESNKKISLGKYKEDKNKSTS